MFLEGEQMNNGNCPVATEQCIVATRHRVVEKKFRILAALNNKENCEISSLGKSFSLKFSVIQLRCNVIIYNSRHLATTITFKHSKMVTWPWAARE